MTSTQGAGRRRGWYYGWNIVAVLILTQIAAQGMPLFSFSMFLHDWSVDLKIPISTIQLAMMLLTFVGAAGGVVVGALADRYPARWLLLAGVLGLALLSLGVAVMTKPWHLVALYGFALPVLIALATLIVANPVVSRWFVRRMGLALGLTAAGGGLAGVVVPPLVATGLPVMGWRGVWQTGAAALALVVAPLIFFVLRERPTDREGLDYVAATAARAGGHHGHGSSQGHGGQGHGGQGHGGQGHGGMSALQIAKRKNFWLLAAIYIPIISAYFGVLYNLAPIAESRGLGAQAGLLTAVLSLAQIVSTPLMGLASDRFGNRLPFLGLCVVSAGGAALVALGHGFPTLLVAAMLVGVVGGLWTLLGASVAAEFGAASAGQGLGLLMAFAPISGSASFLVARMKEATGSYATGLLMLAAAVGIAVAAILAWRERGGGSATAEETAAAVEDAVPTT
jgi:MFS family permease